ncbi:hypothetical protein WR25_16232 [Diploscapter pachys]|uniref:Uncharacterized protein n=1 Tax=Diploscapter pachys TaxID=2018661 RepID=A0A2A2KNN9_9BILA|nr:hypothetical protein WR25_16232 [Diploscapter pachys]
MVLGDSCTGKTCLLVRYKDGAFLNNNFISTVGIDYRNKVIELDGKKIKLQIWDTAGQERFRSVTAAYYRDADALLLVFDVSNRTSFENIRVIVSFYQTIGSAKMLNPANRTTSLKLFLRTIPLIAQNWLAQIKEYGKEQVQVTLVGNKVDLGSARKVRSDEARQLANTYSIPYIETSAKTGHNVNQAFVDLTRRLVALSTGEKYDGSSVVDLATSETQWNKWSSCCSYY